VGALGAVIPGLSGILGGAGAAGGQALSPVLASAALASAVSSARGGGAPSVPELLSVEEVSAALGQVVVSDGAAARVKLGPFELVTFSLPQGTPVLVVSVARGSAVGLVMRGVRRLGTPLPGVGDEAWSGKGWVLARQGQTLVRLTLEGEAPAEALPALLAQALARV
jgi:hypothetical protein